MQNSTLYLGLEDVQYRDEGLRVYDGCIVLQSCHNRRFDKEAGSVQNLKCHYSDNFIYIIPKRLSSELLHCAIVADRDAPWM